MFIIIYISFFLVCVYNILMLLYRVGWNRAPGFMLPDSYTPKTRISVIVPARNEEANITACINAILAQDYPENIFEVIIVDDHSTDSTADIIKSFADRRVKYIDLAEYTTDSDVVAYKKLALTTGIAQCTGSLIVTTDADCTAGKNWLKLIAAKYEQEKPVMIVAPVDYTYNNSIVQVFQSLDFMSMQGITAATLRLRMGNMCNGANLAFAKEAYEFVDGYKNIDHIASGDDYLLMMKLSKVYPNSISYLKSKEAIVKTAPQLSWKSFINQRVRWASKSGKYDDKKMTAVLLMVYLLNVSLLITSIYCIAIPEYFMYLAIVIFFKFLGELTYLLPVARFFDKRLQLAIFPLFEPLHIIYIVLAGFLGTAGVYSWKGRKVK